jgi:hypothetical protein
MPPTTEARLLDRVSAWRPASPRHLLLVLAVVFAVSRLVAGAVAADPMAYGNPDVDPGVDVQLYGWTAQKTLDEGQSAYGDLGLSYPPGALVAMDAPYVAAKGLGVDYRAVYILTMVLVDAACAALLWTIARRTGFFQGVVGWVLLVPLLGPVVYTRFDLLPAFLTLVAVERATVGRWRAVGAFLALSVWTKVYAVFLLPQAFLVSPRRRQVAIGAAIGTAVALVAFVPQLGALADALLHDQGQRGLHWESTFGSLVLLAHALGYPARVVLEYGALDVHSGVSDALRTLSTLLTLGVVVATARRCALMVRRGSAPGLTLSMFGTLALLLGLGSVYSPQYVAWILVLGAAAMALAPRSALPAFLALAGVTVLSHLSYPVLWPGLLDGELLSIGVLLARNLLTIACGVLALRAMPAAELEAELEEPVAEPALA